MNAETRDALEGSIAKWQAILDGTGTDDGTSNCPLCELFWVDRDLACDGCPVKEHTGEPFCRDTPYDEWADLTNHMHHASIASSHNPRKARALAEAELAFLISLRPSEDPTPSATVPA